MQLETQIKLINNPKYKKYLRENSEWYKYLNRTNTNYSLFEDYIKNKYKLRASDKIDSALDNLDLINSVLDTLK